MLDDDLFDEPTLKVLLVDDDRINRVLLNAILKKVMRSSRPVTARKPLKSSEKSSPTWC